MSIGCARSSKKGCGGLAAGRAVRIDEHSVVRFVFERLFEARKSVLGICISEETGKCPSWRQYIQCRKVLVSIRSGCVSC